MKKYVNPIVMVLVGVLICVLAEGVNAHRVGRDYKCESFRIKNDSKLKIHLAPGGGFALKIK